MQLHVSLRQNMNLKQTLAVGLTGILLGSGTTFGALKPADPITQVKEAQEAYKAEHGKYFRCFEYQSPTGVGFQILYEDATGLHSEGTGVEAEQRTFFYPKYRPSATSTL